MEWKHSLGHFAAVNFLRKLLNLKDIQLTITKATALPLFTLQCEFTELTKVKYISSGTFCDSFCLHK